MGLRGDHLRLSASIKELKTAQQSMKGPKAVEHNVGHASMQAEIQPLALEGYKSPICRHAT